MSLPYSTGLVWLTSPRPRSPRRYWIPVPGQRSDNDAGATARMQEACAAKVGAEMQQGRERKEREER